MSFLTKWAGRLNRASRFFASAGFWEGHRSDRRFEDLPTLRGSQDDTTETTGDREEMIGAARAMCQIFGLGNRILKTYANYVLGACEVYFETADEQWNDQAAEVFQAKAQVLDVSGREDFSGIARLALISMLRDGDIGLIKVNQPGFPMLEAVEADRIGPRQCYSITDTVGGIKVGQGNRPLSYGIADRNKYYGFKNPRFINAADFIHIYDPTRFDAMRGISAFAQGALGRSRSLRQILRSEEVAVQTAGKWAVLLKSMAGGFDTSVDSSVLDDVTTPEGKTAKMEEIHDGMIQRLLPGEDVSTVQSNRPSPAWQGFVELLIRDTSISLDLPYEFVWSMVGMTGPGVRMTSRQAERTFRYIWRLMNRRFFKPVIPWVIANAIEAGELPYNPQWYKFHVQRPDHPTIDVGRESQANVSEYECGFMSGAEIASERGGNIYRVMEQKAREIAYAKELAEKHDIPLELLIKVPQKPQAATQEPTENNEQEDNEDEQPKRQQRDQPA